MFEDLVVDRIELLCDQRRLTALTSQVTEDLYEQSRETEVRIHDFYVADPWDFEQMYSKLFDFVRS